MNTATIDDEPRTRHFQRTIKLPSGETLVDEQLADILLHVNRRLHPIAETHFSCQGEPDCTNATAYMVIASTSPTFINDCGRHLTSAVDSRVRYSVPVEHWGEWGTKHYKRNSTKSICRRSERITIEYKTIDTKAFMDAQVGRQLNASYLMPGYPNTIHRLVIRWRPEDFETVESALYEMCSKVRTR